MHVQAESTRSVVVYGLPRRSAVRKRRTLSRARPRVTLPRQLEFNF